MPRPRRDVPPGEVKRLARIRTDAHRAQAKAEAAMVAGLLKGSPDPTTDITGALAWCATVLGPDDERVVELVAEALSRRLEWRELAASFGIAPDDDRGVANLAQMFRRRRQR